MASQINRLLSGILSIPVDVFGSHDPEDFAEALEVRRRLRRLHDDDEISEREYRVLEEAPDWRDVRSVLDEEDTALRARLIAVMELGDRVGEMAGAGLIPRSRRSTKAEMALFRMTLHKVLESHGPMTVRGAFYQMVGRGLPKDENQYARVQRETVRMRRGQSLPVVPYGWLVDGTRWMRKPPSHSSLEAMLDDSIEHYRRAIWRAQPDYVEIWCEKDALAGVLYPVTREWDVPLMVSRGFSSLSFLAEAGMAIEEQGKPAYIYIFTDRDRSGDDIARAIARELPKHAPNAEIHCIRAAVTAEQVVALGLPTRPPKRRGDPPAVELDAIPAAELRRIVRECIERHIDPAALQRTMTAEDAEREALVRIRQSLEAA